MKRYILYGSVLILLISATAIWAVQGGGEEEASQPSVNVERGDITRLALATGTIEPRNEIEVKSKVSGVVSRIYVQEGDYVNEGEPLMDVRPDPTPQELAEAKRDYEQAESNLRTIERELERNKTLKERDVISDHDYEQLQQRYEDARINKQKADERLQLLETGRISVGDMLIESIVRAPSSGYLLEKNVDIGDPVVPLTSYQAGTPVASIAGMDDLIFKGEVDEIDIGSVDLGQRAEIEIGALPNARIYGEVSKISLKAYTEDNKRVFPIEITLEPDENVNLRAGYSANANIITEERNDVLKIPERVISFRGDSSFVDVQGEQKDERIEKKIEVGMSDNISIEVLEGLEEGDEVLEKPVRTLSSGN